MPEKVNIDLVKKNDTLPHKVVFPKFINGLCYRMLVVLLTLSLWSSDFLWD